MEWVRSDGYLVTDDQERLDLVRINLWLSDESYWAPPGHHHGSSEWRQVATQCEAGKPDPN